MKTFRQIAISYAPFYLNLTAESIVRRRVANPAEFLHSDRLRGVVC
jgi:hypothetical protein